MNSLRRLLLLTLLAATVDAGAQVTTYCCDQVAEAAYLAAINGLDTTVYESFETPPWDQVRSPFTLPSVTSQGIIWSQPAGGIKTSSGNSWDGAYQVYAVGPDLIAHPVPDRFFVSGDGITFRAMGGWFTGQNTKIAFIVDGDPNRVNFTGEESTVLDWKFLGFVDSAPFSSVELGAVDEIGNETKLFWADSFTFSASGAPPSPGTVQFSSATYVVAENGGSLLVTVTRTGGSDGAVTVDYATADGSATAGTDYAVTAGTLSFADGVISQSFSVPILDDTVYEGDETFSVNLSNPTGGAATGAQSSATITISENDPAPPAGSLQFGAAAYSVAENGGAVQLTVTRTGGSFGAVSINYSTSDGTATAASDYTPASGVLSFADGEMSKPLNITILDDTTWEGDETFNVLLSGPGGGATLGTPASATVTITENDPTPPAGSLQFSAAAYSVAENAVSVQVTVTRSGGSFGQVTVDYATADGTATAGSDYIAASGTLTFADGVTSQAFNVGMLDDTIWEGDEQFTVMLSNVTGGASPGAPSTATITITENDPVPPAGSLQLSGASYTIAENGGSLLVTATRTGGSFGTVTVDYASSDGSATAGADYSSVSGTLSFADGVMSQTFSVPILDDTIYEGNESFSIGLSNPAGGATLGVPAAAAVTITENDPTPPAGSLQFSGTGYSVAENGVSALVTVTRAGGSFGTVTVDYATADISATAGADYVAAAGTLSLADGVTSATITVAILDDTAWEGNETFGIALMNPTGGATLGAPANATVTIIENDPIPPAGSLRFSGAAYSVAENGGSVLVTVTRVNGSFGNVSVNYSTSDGSATAGSDYTATSGVLSFASGEISRTFSVPVSDDLVYEGDETFTVSLANPGGGATLTTPSTATVTIIENDPVPPAGNLRFSGASYSVSEAGPSVLITVNRVNGSFGPVTVDFSTQDGSAVAAADYTAATGTLSFADGVTSQSFSVPILDDGVYEGAESFTVHLSNAGGGATLAAPATATVTINDNDVAPPSGNLSFSSATYSVGEGGASILLTVDRIGGSFGTVSVDFATTDGSATAGSDYQLASGTLSFADGELSRTFSVGILDDAVWEGDETFSVSLANPTGGASLGAPSTATVTIVENDPAPPAGNVSFEFAAYTIAENGGSIIVNVLRTGGNFGAVTVDFTTLDGSASATSDYVAASGTLTFGDGMTSQPITIGIVDDTTFEGDEQFSVVLSNPGGGAGLATPATATVTIIENDAPPPAGNLQFGDPGYSVSEGGTAVTLTVTRTGGSAGIVSVDYATSDLSAVAGSDYQVATGTLVFDDGVIAQNFDVAILDDVDYEGNESFRATLATPTGGAALGTPSAVDVTIIENDPVPPAGSFRFSGAAYSVDENGASVSLTVQRIGGSYGEATVGWVTIDGTATAGTDYTLSGDILTFPDGVISQSISVPILDDSIYEGDESFNVELRNPGGGATLDAPSTATVTIVEDDPRPPAGSVAFSGTNYSVAENGASVLITVTRGGGSFGAVTVDYSTIDLTATAGADFTATSGTLSLGTGVLSAAFSVPINDDSIYEGDESFQVTLSNPTGGIALGSPATAAVAIVDNDLPPAAGSLQFSSPNYSASEAAASVLLTVSRSGGSYGAVSVDYETRNGSATAGSDYTAAQGTLSFADGEISQSLTVSLIDDTAVEGDETFTVALLNATGGASLGTPATANVSLREDDVNRPSGGGGGGGGGGAFGVTGLFLLGITFMLRTRRTLLLGLGCAVLSGPALAAGPGPAQAGADPHAAHRAMTQRHSIQRTVAEYALGGLAVTAADGTPTTLDSLLRTDRTVILNFIFTTCTTICPVQTATLAQVQRKLGPESREVLILSVSIDPEYDTPEKLRAYAAQFGAADGWLFLTGSSDEMRAVQTAFDAYMGSKMSHRPLTFLRPPGASEWVRLEGMASAGDIVDEVRHLNPST